MERKRQQEEEGRWGGMLSYIMGSAFEPLISSAPSGFVNLEQTNSESKQPPQRKREAVAVSVKGGSSV